MITPSFMATPALIVAAIKKKEMESNQDEFEELSSIIENESKYHNSLLKLIIVLAGTALYISTLVWLYLKYAP